MFVRQVMKINLLLDIKKACLSEKAFVMIALPTIALSMIALSTIALSAESFVTET